MIVYVFSFLLVLTLSQKKVSMHVESDFSSVMSAVVTSQGLSDEYLPAFVTYASNFGKSYDWTDETELALRYTNFMASSVYIASRDTTGLSYNLGHSKFSDLSDEEKKGVLLDTIGEPTDCTALTMTSDLGDDELTSDFQAYDIGIQDQGSCSSCWDFSDIGQMEINRHMETSVSEKLSEQMILDCVSDSIGTCNGGYPIAALNWVKENGGVATEDNYGSYEGEEGTCSVSSGDSSLVAVNTVYCLNSETDEQFSKVVSTFASEFAFKVYYDFYFYTDGIYEYNDESGAFQGYHAVVAIGVDSESYLVKNSWGTSWGDDGYFYMSRDSFDSCSMSHFGWTTFKDYSSYISTSDDESVMDVGQIITARKAAKSKNKSTSKVLSIVHGLNKSTRKHFIAFIFVISILSIFLFYRFGYSMLNNDSKMSFYQRFSFNWFKGDTSDCTGLKSNTEADYLLNDDENYGSVAL